MPWWTLGWTLTRGEGGRAGPRVAQTSAIARPTRSGRNCARREVAAEVAIPDPCGPRTNPHTQAEPAAWGALRSRCSWASFGRRRLRHGAARSFGIDFVIVEPGPTATNFGANIDGPEAMAAYDATPSGDIRRALASGALVLTGDPAQCVDAMIAAGDADRPSLRLALTSTAYANISNALTRFIQPDAGVWATAARDATDRCWGERHRCRCSRRLALADFGNVTELQGRFDDGGVASPVGHVARRGMRMRTRRRMA